jgi:hypothetical protein
MATFRSGANSRLVLAKETTFNTAGTAGNNIPKASFSLPSPYELIENDELRSDPNPVFDEKGLQSGDGWSFDTMLTSDVFGYLSYLYFGDYVVTGAGPYEHVFEVSATDPSSCSVEYGDTGLSKYDLYYGMYLSSFGISATKSSEMMMATIGGVSSGKFDLNSATPLDASPDSYSDRRHVMPTCIVKIDGSATAYLTGVDLTMNREIFPLRPLDGNLYAAGAVLGKYSFDVTLQGWRNSADDLYGLDDDAEHTVEIISSRPGVATHDVSIMFEEAYIYATESASVSGDGPVEFGLRVSPFYANGTSASSVVVTVNSDIADYSAV